MIDRGKHNVLGVRVDAVDYDAAVEQILRAARAAQPLAVSALAVHGVMTGVLDARTSLPAQPARPARARRPAGALGAEPAARRRRCRTASTARTLMLEVCRRAAARRAADLPVRRRRGAARRAAQRRC